MTYIQQAHHSAYYAKLLGTYEQELLDAVEPLCRKPWDRIIDVGAAEGYYAVGLAMRQSQLLGAAGRVIAYEMNDHARQLLANLAELNGVADRIDIRGTCRPGDLAGDLREADRPLIVMDVEGAEMQLLTPQIVPAQAMVLVEVHEAMVPGVRQAIFDRFADTHHITPILPAPRTLADFPLPRPTWLRLLPRSYTLRTMGEKRPPGIDWLVLQPHD